MLTSDLVTQPVRFLITFWNTKSLMREQTRWCQGQLGRRWHETTLRLERLQRQLINFESERKMMKRKSLFRGSFYGWLPSLKRMSVLGQKWMKESSWQNKTRRLVGTRSKVQSHLAIKRHLSYFSVHLAEFLLTTGNWKIRSSKSAISLLEFYVASRKFSEVKLFLMATDSVSFFTSHSDNDSGMIRSRSALSSLV